MTEYKKLHVITLEEFEAKEKLRDEWRKENWSEGVIKNTLEVRQRRDEKRQALKQKFSFAVIVSGSYPEVDNLKRWCWQNISLCDGVCEYDYASEYPGCPLVLATEHVEVVTYKDKDGNGKQWNEKKYEEVPVHEHEGDWSECWLGKTGCEYGNAEFYFKNEVDMDAFIKVVPGIGLGENYT